MSTTSFYVTANGRYFIGVVALVNSLRLAGHEESIVVLDCGLEPWQRELLAPHVRLVAAPPVRAPILLKSHAPLLFPADVMVWIDADMIVVRNMADLIDRSREQNQVIACVDVLAEEVLPGLGRGPRSREPASRALRELRLRHPAGRPWTGDHRAGARWAGKRVDFGEYFTLIDKWEADVGGRRPPRTGEDPFFYVDQDVFNAVLSSRVPPERQLRLENRLVPEIVPGTPFFRGLGLVDATTLREYADGIRPYILHHTMEKPWLQRTRPNLYTRLLPRLLVADDLTIRLAPEHVPLRFRPGLRGISSECECRWRSSRGPSEEACASAHDGEPWCRLSPDHDSLAACPHCHSGS